MTQGPEDFNNLQQMQNQAQQQQYRQLSYTQYNQYEGVNGQAMPMNYEYTIATEQQLSRHQQQEFTPSQKNHSKQNSEALYV